MESIQAFFRIFSFFCLLSLFSPKDTLAQTQAEEEQRQIIAGSVEILDLDFIPGSADVGNQRLLRIREIPGTNQLRIFPLTKGITNVFIRDQRGRIRRNIKYTITSTDLSIKVAYIRTLLENVEGITVNSLGENIVVDGELVVPKDLDRVLNVLEAYSSKKGPKIINLLTLSKVSQRAMAKRIQDEINRTPGGANVTVRLANDTFFLEGSVDSSNDRTRAFQIAETYIPEIMKGIAVSRNILGQVQRPAIRNLISLRAQPTPEKKMIRVSFHFVEISKEYAKSVLFKWSPLISSGAGFIFGGDQGSGTLSTSSQGSLSGTISNLLPKLQKGTNGGYARVLFSTVAIGIEGENISISRTDRIPYIQSVSGGVPVTAHTSAGINISVNPTIQGRDTIRLGKTEFNFSVPSGSGAGDNPRVTTTRLINSITIRSGESAVLGGLISNNISLGVDKDPEEAPNGNPLFTLLRSRAFTNNKTQFIVFITPQIIQNSSKGTEDIKRKIIGNARKRKRIYR